MKGRMANSTDNLHGGSKIHRTEHRCISCCQNSEIEMTAGGCTMMKHDETSLGPRLYPVVPQQRPGTFRMIHHDTSWYIYLNKIQWIQWSTWNNWNPSQQFCLKGRFGTSVRLHEQHTELRTLQLANTLTCKTCKTCRTCRSFCNSSVLQFCCSSVLFVVSLRRVRQGRCRHIRCWGKALATEHPEHPTPARRNAEEKNEQGALPVHSKRRARCTAENCVMLPRAMSCDISCHSCNSCHSCRVAGVFSQISPRLNYSILPPRVNSLSAFVSVSLKALRIAE